MALAASSRTPPWWVRVIAATMGVLAITFAFGPGIAKSIWLLLSEPGKSASNDPAESLLTGLFFLTGGLFLAYGATEILGGRNVTREWLRGRPNAQPGSGLLSAGGALLALLFGYLLFFVLSPEQRAQSANGPLWFELPWRVLVAGLGEEMLVLALPVVLLRHAAPRWLADHGTMVIALLVVLRLSYHVHYGVWVLSLAPWAVTAAWLYLRFGQVWPLVFQHAGYDIVLALRAAGFISPAAQNTLLFVSAVLLIGGGWWLARSKTLRPLS